MTKAYEIGGPSAQFALMTPIFRAHYEKGLDICDAEVLADVAEQASIMSRDEVSTSCAVRKDPSFRPFSERPLPNQSRKALITDLNIGLLRQSASWNPTSAWKR
jgi:predicted DsbA family dithiol-disulfide isomerase